MGGPRHRTRVAGVYGPGGGFVHHTVRVRSGTLAGRGPPLLRRLRGELPAGAYDGIPIDAAPLGHAAAGEVRVLAEDRQHGLPFPPARGGRKNERDYQGFREVLRKWGPVKTGYPD